MGTGTGIIPILLEAKTEGESFTGLEIQEESADMAARSVAYNHLEDKIQIVTGDIKEAATIFGPASFDVITTNPPYMIGEHGIRNAQDAKSIARHEVLCTLDDILRESARILKPGGRFYMVHRPFRLAEILYKMCACKIEPKRMRMVHPYIDKEPNMVLIEGRRGGNPRMTVERPLIVYKDINVYAEPKRMRMVHPYIDKEPNMVLIEGRRGGNPRMTVERPLIVYKDINVYADELLVEYGLK